MGGVSVQVGDANRIAIINGYAKNMELYKAHNRIRTISVYCFTINDFRKIELADNTLSWQVIEADDSGISVENVFPGVSYNKTVIGGFNVYSASRGWLFGEIDE